MKIDYYKYNSLDFVASLDYGKKGFFFLKHNTCEWIFVVPGSIRWDSLHQDLYYSFHDSEDCSDSEIAILPNLPDIPEHTLMKWEDNFRPKGELTIERYPLIARLVEQAAGNSLHLFFTLYEDLYERYCGDGTFRYFSGHIFYDQETAETIVKEKNAFLQEPDAESSISGIEYFLREIQVKVVDGSLILIDWQPRIFQDYDIEKVLEAFEADLQEKQRVPIKFWDEG